MVRIRRMNVKDAPGMHRVHLDAVQQVCAASVSPGVVQAWLYRRSPAGYLRAADKGGEIFWVAVDESDRIVGFASWRENELVGLFVDPQLHGRGIGRKLFDTCEKDAEENGYKITRLNSTLNAQTYYEALGFQTIREGFREMHGQRIPHIEMVRRP
jgi:ribosomal protein S18 acetylase RimI-like enzyme